MLDRAATILVRYARREDGIALVLAVGVTAVLTIVGGAVMTYASSNARSASYSDANQRAYASAEAGVNNAVAVLGLPSNNALDPCLLHPPANAPGYTCASNAPFQNPYDRGRTTWYGTLDQAAKVWTVYSTGSVPNPTGPGTPDVVRRITATVSVGSNPDDPANAAVWNYLVATKTSNATTCDMSLSNSVQVQEPLYVAGNLCLNNTAQVAQPNASDPVKLVVLGKLALQGSNSVGTSDQKIFEADIGGGCTTDISKTAHTCTSSDKVYANTLLSSASAISLPVVDYGGAYASAKPGPKNPCSVTSGTPPTWDNDGILDLAGHPNGSVPTAFNLTPSSSYTCEATDGQGNVVGQLDWNNSTKTLTVKGVMYIDGSVYSDNGAVNLYTGSATLYLTGTFSLSNSTKICGATSGSTCDFANWAPNGNLLIVTAHGNDGNGNSVTLSQSCKWQGGFFAENAIDLGNTSVDEGPMFASTLSMTNSVVVKPLPAITSLPLGAPLPPNTHASPQRPSFSG